MSCSIGSLGLSLPGVVARNLQSDDPVAEPSDSDDHVERDRPAGEEMALAIAKRIERRKGEGPSFSLRLLCEFEEGFESSGVEVNNAFIKALRKVIKMGMGGKEKACKPADVTACRASFKRPDGDSEEGVSRCQINVCATFTSATRSKKAAKMILAQQEGSNGSVTFDGRQISFRLRARP